MAITYLQQFVLILLGHMTTAPWNMFLNNQESFENRLDYNPNQDEVDKTDKNCQFQFCRDDANCTFMAKDDTVLFDSNASLERFTENIGDDTFIENSLSSYHKCAVVTVNPLKNFWSSSLTSVSLTVSLISSLICTTLIQYLPMWTKTKLTWALIMIIFAANILTIWCSYNPKIFFGLELTMAVLIIFIAMVFQTTLFSIFGAMGSVYIINLMEGQGLGGVFIAVSKIVIKKINGLYFDNSNIEATIYWSVAIIVVSITWVLWDSIFLKMEDYVNYNRQQIKNKQETEKPEGKFDEGQQLHAPSGSSRDSEEMTKDDPTSNIRYGPISVCQILYAMKFQAASVFLTFFTCLLLFPAVFSKVRDPNYTNDIGFALTNWGDLNIYLFLVFNIGDWLGKKMANYQIIKWNQPNLLFWVSLLRLLIFYPLAYYGLNVSATKTGFIASKYFLGIVNLCFSITSGYFGSLAMAHCGPAVDHAFTNLERPYAQSEINKAKGKAQTFMVSFLISGLLIGSLTSFVPINAIQSNVALAEKKVYGDHLLEWSKRAIVG